MRRGNPSAGGKNHSHVSKLSSPTSSKSKLSRSQIGTTHWLAIGLTVALIGVVVHLCHVRLPEPLAPNDANDRFSEKRAFEILNELSDYGPKPSGSVNCEELTVRRIHEELRVLKKAAETGEHKLDIENQLPSGCFAIPRFDVDGFGLCYRNVSNVIARLSAKDRKGDSGALLINCHYDSWATSPAGSDDLASCALMLEVIRILADPRARPVAHDVIFLFNGAEEASLLASHGFITQHNESRRIVGFINLEASGSGGREILFQSGPDSQWLLHAYLTQAPYPHCSVLGQEVFQSGIVPSDTDFRIFRDYGKLSGLDFAFAQNAYWWHTEFDEARRISPGSLQRAGENILAVLKSLLSDRDFDKAATYGKPTFVFFDFLGFITIAYSRNVAWMLNAVVAALILIGIRQRFTDLEAVGVPLPSSLAKLLFCLVGYPVLLFIIGVINRYQLKGVNELLDGRLLWLTNHSVVIPLIVLPAVCWVLFAFEALIFFCRTPEKKLLLAWALFDAHNIWCVVATFAISSIGSAGGFLFLALLLPSAIDAVSRVVLHRSAQTLRPHHHLYFVLPLAILPFTLLYYNLEVILSVFIPILGRSKGDTDFVVLLICLFGVLATSFYVIPLIAFTQTRTRDRLRVLFVFVYAALLVTVFTAAPYRYTDKFPTTRRTQFFHVLNRVEGGKGLSPSKSSQLLAIAQDNRQVHDIPLVGKDAGFEEIDCTNRGRYCHLPFLYPTAERLGPSMIRAKNVLDSSLQVIPATMQLREEKELEHNQHLFDFLFTGSDQMSVVFDPVEGVEIVEWRLKGASTSVCNSTFAFLSCNGKNCGNWEIELTLRGSPHSESGWLEVMVASHALHGPQMYSDTLKALQAEIQQQRAAGDWRWAMTASSWTVDLLRRRF